MMLWILIMTATCALTAALGQPPACNDDSECTSGYFCRSEDKYCRECLRCEDLHRQPPLGHVSCVRLVSECGLCFKGYVDDRLDMGSGCTEPESAEAVAWYLWLLGGLVIACLLVCAVGMVIYALRNTDSFRVIASTRTSVEAPVVGKPLPPTAPQSPQPPPYNYAAPYEPVRPAPPENVTPASPYARGDYAYRPTSDSEAERPLVKRVPGAGGQAARESAGSQSARVYTNPAYVRNVPPPSYDSAFSDDSDHEQGAFQPHDEETMPSDWTPAASDAAPANEGPAAAAGEGEAASGATALVRRPARDLPASPPPNKIRCVEDSNNNHNGGPGNGPSSPPPPGAAAAPPPPPPPAPAPHVIINVLNVNAVHQRNDVTL